MRMVAEGRVSNTLLPISLEYTFKSKLNTSSNSRMKNPRSNLWVVVCVVLICGALLVVAASPSSDWLSYKQQYGKNYASRAEEAMRRTVFARNKEQVEKFNAKNLGYKLGLNHLSDRTESEMNRRLGLRMPKNFGSRKNSLADQLYLQQILKRPTEVPDEIDYRKQANRVTPVKDQGNCGSCWAFATTGVLEGQEIVANKSKLVSLSEQNLIDCDKGGDDHGCHGGWMEAGFNFIKNEGGIDDEQSYPYTAFEGECKFKRSKVAMTDSGAVVLKDGSEDDLKKLVAKFGPVAVGIYAGYHFQHYNSGVYYNKECFGLIELNHAVLLVGYGTDAEAGDYWLIKNTWGTNWGEQGYVRLARNKNNHCGITAVPTISKL